jgi:hypothetical protein
MNPRLSCHDPSGRQSVRRHHVDLRAGWRRATTWARGRWADGDPRQDRAIRLLSHWYTCVVLKRASRDVPGRFAIGPAIRRAS